MKALRIPFAEWRPSPNHGYFAGGSRLVLEPKAIVPHSADSQIMADPPARFFSTSGGGSTHLWIRGDGHLIQMIDLDEPAWGNGALDSPSGVGSLLVIVREWYRVGRNPNLDTISLEFSGQGVSRGANFRKPTDQQIATWVRLNLWLQAEEWLTATPENTVLHGQISATACPDGRFTAAELLSYLEEEMPDPRVDKLIAALGGEPAIDEWNANGNSLLLGYAGEQGKLDKHIAKHPSGGLAPHTHVPGGVTP